MKRALVAVAVSFVALTASQSARADMLYLTCKYLNIPNPRNLTINLTNNTLIDEGVYPAAISATSIYVKVVTPEQIIIETLIDRITGTITRTDTYPGRGPINTGTGRCTASATPPHTKF